MKIESKPRTMEPQPQDQDDHFLEKAAQKTKEDLLRWYPPLVVENNPAVRGALVALFPPLGRVFELTHQAYEGFKKLFRNKDAPR